MCLASVRSRSLARSVRTVGIVGGGEASISRGDHWRTAGPDLAVRTYVRVGWLAQNIDR